MVGIYSNRLNLFNLESKDKDVGNITSVKNVTRINSISSAKNKTKTNEKQNMGKYKEIRATFYWWYSDI